MKVVIVLHSLSAFLVASAGRWTEWQSLGPCKAVIQPRNRDLNPVDLQEGTQTWKRFCLEEDNDSDDYEDEPAFSNCEKDDEQIESRDCRIPTVWSKFEALTPCSVKCGSGIKQMRRRCIINSGPPPPEGEKNEVCQLGVEETDFHPCKKRPCPIDGGWGNWSDWGACGSEECNFPKGSDVKGHQYRTRTCSNPSPKYGGKMCEGPFLEFGICADPVNCRADGAWSPWTGWGDWDCKSGTRNRTRVCNNPAPRNGGKECQEGGPIMFFLKNQNMGAFNKTCGNFKDLDENPNDENPDEKSFEENPEVINRIGGNPHDDDDDDDD